MPEDQGRLCVVADGAPWLRLMRLYVGQGVAVPGGLGRLQATAEEAAQARANCRDDLNAHRAEPPSKSSVEEAMRWAVGGWKHQTSAWVTDG